MLKLKQCTLINLFTKENQQSTINFQMIVIGNYNKTNNKILFDKSKTLC